MTTNDELAGVVEADSILQRQKIAIARNAMRRPRLGVNLIPWERYKAFPLTVAALLASCNQQPAGADGYAFEAKEFTRLAPAATFVVHRSQAELVAAAPAATRDAVTAQGRQLMAWSVIRPSGCEVHIVDPAVRYAPEWIGHEVTHCVYGRFHP